MIRPPHKPPGATRATVGKTVPGRRSTVRDHRDYRFRRHLWRRL